MEKMSLILPPVKKKIMGHLTKGQKYEIFVMLQANYSKKKCIFAETSVNLFWVYIIFIDR
jgi:hypothetical protein